jgi:hypothetical protein
MTVKQVVAIFYILAIASACFAVILAITLRTRYVLVIYAILFLSTWTLLWVLGMVNPPQKSPVDHEDPKAS